MPFPPLALCVGLVSLHGLVCMGTVVSAWDLVPSLTFCTPGSPWHCTEPCPHPSVWHKLTTYEYIVQHRPPQEARGAHRQLESCPPKMRPIQVHKWPRGLRGGRWELGGWAVQIAANDEKGQRKAGLEQQLG